MKTNNDILEKLKKDVIKAKEIIEKEECFHFKYLEKDPAVDCNEYFIKLFIITNKNDTFIIRNGSFVFPDIDVDDIIYIQKERLYSVNDNHFIDSEVGDFDSDEPFGRYYDVIDSIGNNLNYIETYEED